MKNSLTKKKQQGSITLKLFGAIFLIVGLVAGYLSLKPVFKSLSTSNWESVPATVIEAKLENHRTDDTTTFKATGKYQYNWNGRSYTSEKLNFSGGSDNVGTYQKDLVDKLRKAQASNDLITAWVNPDNPSEAVIDKTIRWSMAAFTLLFFVVFGGAGAGIIFAADYIDKAEKRETERKQLYPNKPWRWRDEWQTLELSSSSKKEFLFSVVFAIFWCVISLPILFILPEEVLEKKNYLALIALMFPIVGVGLATWAIRSFFRWKRFKDTIFTLDSMPFYLGRRVKGSLTIQEKLPADTQFNVKLSCIHKYTSGSGKNKTTKEDVKWQDEQNIPIIAGAFSNKYSLPIQFKLPKNQPISNWENARSEYLWRLSIQSEIEGADFSQDFNLPVFDSNESDVGNLTEKMQSDSNIYESNVYTYKGDWQKINMVYQDRVNTKRYYFPAARHKGMAILATTIALVLGSFGIAGFFIGDMPFMMAVIVSVIGASAIYGALLLWLHKTETMVSQGKITVRSGMFNAKETTLSRQDIKTLTNKISMFAGRTQYYDIIAETHQGKKIRIATHLKGIRDVEALIKKMSDDLGLASN